MERKITVQIYKRKLKIIAETNPCGMPLVTALHLDLEPLITTAIQPISYPLSGPSVKSICLQFSDKDVLWASDKILTLI